MLRSFIAVLLLFLAACGPGEAGPPGPAGEQGSPGVGLRVSYFCSGSALVNATVIRLVYSRYEFADESVMTECEVADASGTRSSMDVYHGDTEGAAFGRCYVGFDVDGDAPSFGTWRFEHPEEAKLSVAANYVDQGSQNNNRRLALGCQQF